jgi:hypothetical protein
MKGNRQNHKEINRCNPLHMIAKEGLPGLQWPIPCPTANPKQLTDARESVDSSIDERSLQVDLVRLDWAVPVARRVGSRNSCTSAPAQCPAAQIPEASGPQQHRAVACWALSRGSRGCPYSKLRKPRNPAFFPATRILSRDRYILATTFPSSSPPAPASQSGLCGLCPT